LLEKVNEYKYLSLIFNSNGKLNNASQNLVKKGRKAYFGFRSKIQFGNNLSVKNWLNLYDSIISPIVTYGSEIWISDFDIKLLNNIHVLPFEKAQNMMMKNILGVHGKTSNLALHAELGLFPLCFKAFKLMFRYYTRLIQLEENNDSKYDLLRSAFEENKQLFNHNNTSWVKSLFQMESLFNLPSLDISYSDLLEKIKLTYINKIMSQLSHIKNTEKGKLRFYSNVYTTFELQKYLTFGISKSFILFLSKIRLSAHSLAIETERYNKPFTPAKEILQILP
jgi:hypothetical protein